MGDPLERNSMGLLGTGISSASAASSASGVSAIVSREETEGDRERTGVRDGSPSKTRDGGGGEGVFVRSGESGELSVCKRPPVGEETERRSGGAGAYPGTIARD